VGKVGFLEELWRSSFLGRTFAGHYELNLASLVDRMIVRKLADCAYYEGQWPNWRNFSFGLQRECSMPCAPAGWMSAPPLVGTVSVPWT
jgi:hypothetical protein